MEILANREHVLPALMRTASVVERRQTLPILGNVLIQGSGSGLMLCGTDLEMEVRSRCQAEVRQEGETTVPARKLLDIVRNLPEGSELRLRVGEGRCTVTSGRGRYVLGTLPAGDFPVQQREAERLAVLALEGGVLKRLLDKTAFAMAQQDVRYYLNGLLLELGGKRIRAVATDGHRLARLDVARELDLEQGVSVIVPFKAVMELRRQLGSEVGRVEVEVGERTIRVVAGGDETTSKLVDGRYPDYERVIPVELGSRAVADREELRRALARAAVLSNEKYRGVRVTFEPGVVRLQAHNPEQEEAIEEIEAEVSGEVATIGFNVAYLADVLGAVETERVEVRFADGNSSSVWRGTGGEEETYVVMPMRL